MVQKIARPIAIIPLTNSKAKNWRLHWYALIRTRAVAPDVQRYHNLEVHPRLSISVPLPPCTFGVDLCYKQFGTEGRPIDYLVTAQPIMWTIRQLIMWWSHNFMYISKKMYNPWQFSELSPRTSMHLRAFSLHIAWTMLLKSVVRQPEEE
jgi:hypothetical protein